MRSDKTRQSETVFCRPPWRISEALVVIILTIIIPAGLIAWLTILSKLAILPAGLTPLFISDSVSANTVTFLISLAVECSLLYWIVRKYHLRLSALGLRRFNLGRSLLYIVLFYAGFVAVLSGVFVLISWLAPIINLSEPQKTGFEFGKHGHGLIFSFIVTVMIAPVIEEVYFRGFLLPAITKTTGIVLGAMLTSIIFGVLHFQANVIIYTFILGLFLSFLYYKLGSIIPGIGLHMVNNLIAFLTITNFTK